MTAPCSKCGGTGKIPNYGSCVYCNGTAVEPWPIKYAGIGARETPVAIGKQMEMIAALLSVQGLTLRSGAAKQKYDAPKDTVSADLAFEAGCDSVKGRKVIRVPTSSQQAHLVASQFHPNWNACNEYARNAHARNTQIMLGDYYDEPVKFVVCWTPGGAVTGGTGHALRIAAHYNIPVYNFGGLNDGRSPNDFWGWFAGL